MIFEWNKKALKELVKVDKSDAKRIDKKLKEISNIIEGRRNT